MINKVVDLANLHPGIEHYYRGTSNSELAAMMGYEDFFDDDDDVGWWQA